MLWADPARLMRTAGLTPDRWQEEVLLSSALQTLLLCSRQSGKSTTAAALAINTALLEPPALVLLLSPTLRQSGELFRDKIVRMYRAADAPVPVAQVSALQMTLANGSRIISLPGDEETIRGFSGVSLLIIDEASRVPDDLYNSVRPMLAVSGGRLIALTTPFGKRGWFYREWEGAGPWERVMVTADQCPRISRQFLDEERRQLGPQWYAQEYLCQFTDGGSTPMYPAEWLSHAASLAAALGGRRRVGRAIGIDPAEGGDMTAMAVVDEYGLIELVSRRTPDTSVIVGEALAFMRKWQVPASRVMFDSGGGGKQHADRLRSMGYDVCAVGFGESVVPPPRLGVQLLDDRQHERESRYTYFNRRAQMYGTLRQLLDPAGVSHDEGRAEAWDAVAAVTGSNMRDVKGFAIPAEYTELRRQLAPIPMTYDGEGRLYLLPKNKRDPKSNVKTLTELIGCSPDEADALALSVYGLTYDAFVPTAGGMW